MKNNNSIRPEDLLPNGQDTTIINGKEVRKGTIAAFLANTDILESQNATEEQREDAIDMLKELAPGVIAIGLHRHVQFKNAQVEQILLDAENIG